MQAPKGLEAALKWATSQLKENPRMDRVALADKASIRFDLSPKDGDAILRLLKQ